MTISLFVSQSEYICARQIGDREPAGLVDLVIELLVPVYEGRKIE